MGTNKKTQICLHNCLFDQTDLKNEKESEVPINGLEHRERMKKIQKKRTDVEKTQVYDVHSFI